MKKSFKDFFPIYEKRNRKKVCTCELVHDPNIGVDTLFVSQGLCAAFREFSFCYCALVFERMKNAP